MSARRLALAVLERVERDDAWLRPALDAALSGSGLAPADRAFAAELCHGVLRWRARLDHAIGAHARRGLASIDPGTLRLLRLGAYQLLFTRVKPHAAVHETVDLARAHGGEPAARFVNALLRSIIRAGGAPPLPDPAADFIRHLEVRESFPRWVVERWVAAIGSEQAALALAAQNEVPPLTVRVNRRRATREQVVARLAAEGARATPTRHAPHGLRVEGLGEVGASAAFREGLFTVQDEASQLVAELVAPPPGARVLDACAAPGGKATALAEAVPDGSVDAVDIHAGRLALVSQAAARLGLSNVRTFVADAAALSGFVPAEGYAAVLCDAPCSGLGVLRRHPDARWRCGPEQIPELAALQARLLESLARHVAPGGVLVYSVCTFTPEETEGVVVPFLAAHPDFRLDDRRPWPELFDGRGFFRTLPHRHGMDSFFAARLVRSGGSS